MKRRIPCEFQKPWVSSNTWGNQSWCPGAASDASDVRGGAGDEFSNQSKVVTWLEAGAGKPTWCWEAARKVCWFQGWYFPTSKNHGSEVDQTSEHPVDLPGLVKPTSFHCGNACFPNRMHLCWINFYINWAAPNVAEKNDRNRIEICNETNT